MTETKKPPLQSCTLDPMPSENYAWISLGLSDKTVDSSKPKMLRSRLPRRVLVQFLLLLQLRQFLLQPLHQLLRQAPHNYYHNVCHQFVCCLCVFFCLFFLRLPPEVSKDLRMHPETIAQNKKMIILLLFQQEEKSFTETGRLFPESGRLGVFQKKPCH